MPPARTDTQVWALASPPRIHLRRFEDQAVVYDERSGDTHLLQTDAAALLIRLRETGPQPAAALMDELAPEHLEALLQELHGLGLVRSVPR